MKRLTLRIISILILLVLGACSSIDENLDTTTAEGAYKLGQALEKEDRYEEAIMKYQEVKNQHPYSKFATLAELAIADVHFKREAYIESQGAYQLFKDFHPKHPKIAYVTYQLGLSYFNQLPSTIDRDLTIAKKAIIYFREVERSYSRSEYAKKATEKRNESLKRLAQKELYIADFYFKRESYKSALGRYEGLLETYPNLGLDIKATYGAAVSAHRAGERNKSQSFLKKLLNKYPTSQEASKAKREIRGS